MKKTGYLELFIIGIFMGSCSSSDDTPSETKVQFNFTQNWDGEAIGQSDFNTIKYTNAHGEQMSIERLRYLISDITFHKSNGESIALETYYLIDPINGTNLTFSPDELIEEGEYSSLSFTFGFDNEDNQDGAYADLNTAIWNVPEMLGGGYHYMQLEGKYINNSDEEIGYQYHAIRAVDITGASPVFQDTFFEVDLGPVTVGEGSSIEVEMNVAEWFKNPNTWNLNALYSMMMPNFDAQVSISENGQDVFSLNTNP